MPRNKIEDLRNHLFETLEMLKDGEIEVEKAQELVQRFIDEAYAETTEQLYIPIAKKAALIAVDEKIKQIKGTFIPNKGASRTESPTSDLIINHNGKTKSKFDF